jgi:uncharacterized protein YecT (DUF1311 family)
MRKRTLITTSILLLSPFAHATTITNASWHLKEPVIYQNSFDPNGIELKNGERLTIQYGEMSWQETSQWKKGKSLILGYSPTLGTYLENPTNKHQTPVLSGVKNAPIDTLLQRCTDKNDSTYGMLQCISQANQQWDHVLNRNYQRLMHTLSPEQQTPVRNAQRQWIAFRDGQIKAIQAIYDRQGTLWGVIASEKVMDLTKDQAQRLSGYLTM